MRLGQLARKLSLRPSQLVDFLSEKNIETQEGSNTRLDDRHVEWIIQEFAPERLEEILNPVTEEILPEIVVEEPITVEEPIVIESGIKIEEPIVVTEEEIVAEVKEEPEVIRVQKIELSGLKVLGKIELPEPKKKEVKTEETSSDETQQSEERRPRGSAKSKHPPRRERDQRNLRNPLEVQRQREAREREEQRKAELEREKEKRKHHYQNKVKQVQQPKRVKPVKETGVAKKPVDTRPAPKTLLGKFLRWWTT